MLDWISEVTFHLPFILFHVGNTFMLYGVVSLYIVLKWRNACPHVAYISQLSVEGFMSLLLWRLIGTWCIRNGWIAFHYRLKQVFQFCGKGKRHNLKGLAYASLSTCLFSPWGWKKSNFWMINGELTSYGSSHICTCGLYPFCNVTLNRWTEIEEGHMSQETTLHYLGCNNKFFQLAIICISNKCKATILLHLRG